MQKQLSHTEVRNHCLPEDIAAVETAGAMPPKMIIGQDRAVKALKLGLGMRAHGFNMYVSGSAGTGKLTAVTGFVQQQACKEAVPPDWCYVNNFKDAYMPNSISMPPGTAVRLRKDMRALVSGIYAALVKAFESEEYAGRKGKLVAAFEDEQSRILGAISELAEQQSFILKQTSTSFMTIPVKDNKPITDADLKKMTEAEIDEINRKQDMLQDKLSAGLREIRKHEKATNEQIEQLSKEVALFAMGSLIEDMTETYSHIPEVVGHLADLKDDLMDNLPEFLKSRSGKEEEGENPFEKRYEVNVLVDNSGLKGAPVITERNPTYNNLLGRVEKESYMGSLITDFTMIRKGSLHSANGGYLIIRMEELAQAVFAWAGLKRTLKNREIVIEEATDQLGYMTTRTLKPEPIPLDLKIILIGDPRYYQLLYQYDPEFKELFKVKADFDSSMERNSQHIADYVTFTDTISAREGLLPADDTGKARIVEYGSRLADDQYKLSTQFGDIADILREASYYATQETAKFITGNHIRQAIEEKLYRSSLVQERITEMIAQRTVYIDTTGLEVGQINGLSVIGIGDVMFGMPVRITCSVSLGRGEVIAIEREAELSGPLHTKGVLILSGFLAGMFMYDKPLSLSARLVFEQSYSEVDGDSASSTELYAILSALSGLPIRQGIAVTGSVNQKGRVQAIGGVNEKVEGYYELCRQVGLNGEQGVMIPAANVRNLMLKEEIVEAVKNGRFHVWAVDSIEDGIEVLTGIRAGRIGEAGTVYDMVNNTLIEFSEKVKSFSITEGKRDVIIRQDAPPPPENPVK